jgi:predicted enzyme related to lactoylglutathione lyase
MHIQFAELPVVDQERATRFYVEALGCHMVADSSTGEGWRWIELGLPGAQTNVHFVRRAGETAPDMPVMVLVAEDVIALVEGLKRRGVDIVAEPHNPAWEPRKTIAEFRDSEGNRIVISSP